MVTQQSTDRHQNNAHRVVIVGGGFAGLQAARNLRKAPVEVTLIDRQNYHLFQPLLYQVATGGLSPGDIASPLRGTLKRQKNARTIMAEALDINSKNKTVVLRDGEIPYDTLIVATGASHNYFGNKHWEEHAPGLKTIDDATQIRARILSAFERAERESNPEKRRALMTFVIVGGGPTGVELAGALAEIARDTLKHEFRAIDPRSTKIVLIQRSSHLLETYPEDLSEKSRKFLEKLGVTVRTEWTVTDVKDGSVTMSHDDQSETIRTETILWAAGVQASDIGKCIASAFNAEIDKVGRVHVNDHLQLSNHPEVYVLGDLANAKDESGEILPGVAAVAVQEGSYAAKCIRAQLKGDTYKPFKYWNMGSLATIGRAAAVADFGWIRFSGFFAWLLWLFVHLMKLVGYENRLLVFVQWAGNYVTFNRSARLITGQAHRESIEPVEKLQTSMKQEPV